jgi:hypothetical protein
MRGLGFDIYGKDKTGRAFDSVDKKMGGLKHSIGALSKSFGGLGAAVTAAFSIGALKQVASFVDNIQKVAIRTGVTTEALSEYAYISELSGVSQEVLSKSIGKLGINVSNAGKGLKVQSQALADLGLSYQELINLPLNEQFEMVGDRLRGVSNQADKLRIANDLLGRSGIELLTVFDESNESIADMRARLIELNGVVGQETANNIAAMNDSWAEVGTALKGVGIIILDTFSPTLEYLGHTIADLIAFIGDMVKALQFARDSIAAASIKFQEFVGIIDSEVANDALAEMAKGWNDVFHGVKATGDEVEKLKQSYEGLESTSGGGISAHTDKVKEKLKGIKDAGDDAAKGMGEVFSDTLQRINIDFNDMRGTALGALEQIGAAFTKNILQQNFAGSGGGQGFGGMGFPMPDIGGLFQGFFAGGGGFFGGKSMVVGERGPEILNPKAGGTVIPNHQLGGNQVFNFNFPPGTDVAAFKRSQGQIAAQVAATSQRGMRNL